MRTFCGYRLLAVDGSSLKSAAYPEDPASYRSGTPRQHGWNLWHMNALYDLENGIYTDLIVQKEHEKNECKALCQMAERSPVSGKVILLADRNYESCNNLAYLEKKGWNYLIRIRDKGRAMAYLFLDGVSSSVLFCYLFFYFYLRLLLVRFTVLPSSIVNLEPIRK